MVLEVDTLLFEEVKRLHRVVESYIACSVGRVGVLQGVFPRFRVLSFPSGSKIVLSPLSVQDEVEE